MRLNGIQVARAIRAGGGLYSKHHLARIVNCDVRTIGKWSRKPGWPEPCAYTGKQTFYAGEDILRFCERTGRWAAAEKIDYQINHYKLTGGSNVPYSKQDDFIGFGGAAGGEPEASERDPDAPREGAAEDQGG